MIVNLNGNILTILDTPIEDDAFRYYPDYFPWETIFGSQLCRQRSTNESNQVGEFAPRN